MPNSNFTQKDFDVINSEFESLMELAHRRCRQESETAVIRKAFEFANSALKDIRRRSGDPYILHPIAVAKIVVGEIGLGYKSISAALLHDVVSDTGYTFEDITNLFGEKIGSLVEGLSKIKVVLDSEDRKGVPMSPESAQAENLKRILLTLNDDARVVLIKLADRLHNCRTIADMPEAKRDRILSETMFLFIPLAHRLGLYSIKSEMENIWLQYKEPDAYNELTRRIKESVETNKDAIENFIAPISGALRRDDFDFVIKTRIKSPYSVWHKMRTKKVTFEQIYDLYAVRIIFNPSSDDPEVERKQAYMIYADIIGLFKENPGRHRDWIETPKSNGYEALHSTLMSQAGIWVEVQIRSKRMDDIAEKGIAAHWNYKQGGYASENESKMDKWLTRIKEVLANEDFDALELLDIIHSDLITSDIVVYTPKGDQITIPNGATAHDFAYIIHSHIGERAIAAKINMKLAPLSQVLRTGDQVEIITSETARPYKEWLQYLKTRNARAKVINYFRDQMTRIVKEGEESYREILHVMGLSPCHEHLRQLIEYTHINDSQELFFRLGLGLISPEEFRMALDGVGKGTGKNLGNMIVSEYRGNVEQYIAADCCNPIPGDAIIGYLSEDGKTVLVHKKSCSAAERMSVDNADKAIALHWISSGQELPVAIRIHGIDEVGSLNRITYYLSLVRGINLRKLQLDSKNGIFNGYFEFSVKDSSSLDEIIKDLKQIDGIQDVVRTDI